MGRRHASGYGKCKAVRNSNKSKFFSLPHDARMAYKDFRLDGESELIDLYYTSADTTWGNHPALLGTLYSTLSA